MKRFHELSMCLGIWLVVLGASASFEIVDIGLRTQVTLGPGHPVQLFMLLLGAGFGAIVWALLTWPARRRRPLPA